VGYTNTNATLAGTIAPPDYAATHPVGIIKEGTGIYRISGNNNFLSGSLRVLDGRVLVMDNVAETDSLKLRGALGAMPDESMAVAFVFEKGTLGGTGSIGGTVDNYGTVEPGADGIGTLTIKNFAEAKDANLYVHPKSVLKFKIGSASKHDQLTVGGSVKFFNTTEDFTESSKMPLIGVEIEKDATVAVGDEFVVLTAKNKDVKAGEWAFQLKRPEQYTWEILESTDNGVYEVKLKITSLDEMAVVTDPDTVPNYTPMGAFYDDGIDDKTDLAPLRLYAEKNGKYLGTAISTWKNDMSNPNLAETKEVAAQFNMLVAENEMKFNALEPSRDGFDFSGADKLVNFAQANQLVVRGHCLAWHSQLPEWVSSDGKKNDRNWSREEALQILKNHIDKVMAHYKGKVAEWDVVNECLSDNQGVVRTKPGSYDLRQSVWTLAIGEDFIDSAFVYAHRADPDAQLYLNDYDVEFQGKAKSEAFYNLAIRLKNSGIPIDGVGVQCHFSVGGVDSVRLDATVRRFAKAGLKCIITELDMGIPSTSAADLEEQARNYRVITDIVLNNDNCPNLVIWGLKDNNSWRDSSNPLLYTAGLAKKPAWYAVRSAMRHRTGKIDYTPATEPEEDPETKTDIEDEPFDPSATDDAIYDMFGRRVDGRNLKPGLYIRGGKKIYIFK
jgi:GH35 family endo-1,4-beta-xylanase